MMKPTLLAVCFVGVALLSGAEAQAQGIAVGVPVYTAPVYAPPVYAAPVYAAPVYPTAVYPTTTYAVPAYASTAVYYSAPAAVYADPLSYPVAAPVVVGAPVRVYGHWGRHHAHFYYRW
jgi:hypothetical protein